jgi:Zn-dependent M28 family amino/carboxypeptidase
LWPRRIEFKTEGIRMRQRSWVLSLCVAAGLALGATGSASAVTPTICSTQVNDTPDKLLPCITTDDLWVHMKAFDAIAKANPGADGHPSRNSGEPGYKASVDYVAQNMKAAGYDVTIQTYTFDYFTFTAIPSFSEVSPTPQTFVLNTDWGPGQAAGTATGKQLQAAGGIVLPPTTNPSSASGCTAADFTGFVPGRIALIQRGTCTFGTKVQNAAAAGATGVIIFNEGNPGRTGLVVGSLQDAAGNPIIPNIPVAFTTFAIGQSLFTQISTPTPPVMTISTPAVVKPNAEDYNLIAESKGGDPNHVLVVDAHLDAIFGEGMLDNASGSTTILDIAQQMKNVAPRNKLRFIWFGGEELGLLGSKFYVNNLSPSERNKIAYDLDADVTATPNYLIGVLDPTGPDLFQRNLTTAATFPNRVYKPSTIARDQAVTYLNSLGLNHEFLSPTGTDAFSFNSIGVPASGVLTGQDCCKLPDEVALFGGHEGNFEGNVPSFDGGCVDNPFRWCDNLDNNDPQVLTFMSRTFATMVVQMAFDTNIKSSSNNAVINTNVPAGHSAGRRFVAE